MIGYVFASFTVFQKEIFYWIALSACILHFQHVFGQTPQEEPELSNSVEIPYLWAVHLNPWADREGRKVEWPIEREVDSNNKLVISQQISLECIPDDTVWLYIEKAAWITEWEWDDYYVGVSLAPFSPVLIPIPPDWFLGTSHNLRVNFSYGKAEPLYPQPIVGMWGKAYLLESHVINGVVSSLLSGNSFRKIDQEYKEIHSSPDNGKTKIAIGMVAPYYRDHGYSFDPEEALLTLLPLLEQEISYVYFPFPADLELIQLSRSLGLTILDSLPDYSELAWINSYPYDDQYFSYPEFFWLDESGARTEHVGNYTPLIPVNGSNPYKRYRFLFACLTLFPFLCLLFIKIINPGLFQSLQNLLMKPKLFIDNFSDYSFSNSGLLFFLTLIRLSSIAITWALFVYYIQGENQWHVFTFIRDVSFVRIIFEHIHSPWLILGICLLCLFGWMTIKYLALSMISFIFGIKELLVGITSLDIVSAYPIILFTGVIEIAIIFSDVLWAKMLVMIFLAMMGIYFLRIIYVYHVGLTRLFSFSSRMKFLYICTFNILPYIIWL